jgi:lipopolysaccharide biosynthesis glycosyltransferase
MNNCPKIEIAIASDSNYLVPTTVLLKSLFENNKEIVLSINLLYLTSATERKDLDFWAEYVTSHGHLFHTFPVSDEQIHEYPVLRHSKSTYLRLLLPILLPDKISKILYLDADTITVRNLLDLYQTDITNYYAAAAKEVLNIYAKTDKDKHSHLDGIGIVDSFYFGAGVMLMNIKKMKEESVVSKYFIFAKEHPEFIRWSDQDVVNAVLNPFVKYIPPKYNMNYNVEPDVIRALWNSEEVREAQKFPAIIHYIGPTKPWNYLSFHPKTKLWWKYLKMTPFKDFKPQNRSFGNFFKKYYLIICWRIMSRISLSQKRKIGKLLPDALKRKFKKSVKK